ncbi:Sialyltransferase-like protein 2 [Nymphaea thermarum]|nr:Sialyltransferase-like protein 2 [Nymphaea thermarum]
MRTLKYCLIVATSAGFFATLIYISGVSKFDQKFALSDADIQALGSLQRDFEKCVVRNSTTILTKEFIDNFPNGWEEYAWRRINKGILFLFKNTKTMFLPHNEYNSLLILSHICTCDLLQTSFGEEIDGYDAVVRENGAPIENYTKYVGNKRTFRLLNRGSAKALDKVAELDGTGKEVLIIKTTIHDVMSKMIREVPIQNPVHLMLGASFGSSAKGTGLKALEFALSVCDSVDMFGFTVDPGYKEWTRYFSESRQGHTPLQGRAYYQMMECLGLVKIHSPMRADFNRVVHWVPSRDAVHAARIASEKMLGTWGAGTGDPLAACSIIGRSSKRVTVSGLRWPAAEHQKFVKGATLYPLEHRDGHGMLCLIPEVTDLVITDT